MKELIYSRFKTLSILFSIMSFSIILLMVRMKITHSFFFLFMVWNLFLAIIPFGLTLYLRSFQKMSLFPLLASFGLWLLFLPNAPYIITDLIHLPLSEPEIIWLDILMVVSFAFSGILCYIHSVRDMYCLLENSIKSSWVRLSFKALPFLVAFGVYLGRFMRYNSWDIVHHPFQLLFDCIDFILSPIEHWEVWGFTLGFGIFLSLVSKLMQIKID